jgi:hypothetical protein
MLKGIEWGVIYLPRMNSLQILFFGYLEKKNCSMCTENTQKGEISFKSMYISDIYNTNLTFFKFFLSTLHGMD